MTRTESRARLLQVLKPGDTVYTILKHVSRSGMQRRIDLYAIVDGRPLYLTGHVANLLGYHRHPTKDGLTVNGCGMDMGFHLVYQLGSVLWPDGTPEPHGTRNSMPDTDGGYALKHEWL